MCEELFRDESVIRRLRQGPLGPYVDEFVSDLQQQGYSTATIRKTVFAMDRFGQWLQNQNLDLEDAHEQNAERYRDTLDRYASGSLPTAARGLNHGIAFLRRKGIVKHQAASAPLTPAKRWLLRFDAYLERVGGAADSTRKQYHTILVRFLDARFGISDPDWSSLSANDLTSFIQREAAQRRGFGRKVPPVALRAFLRFLVSQGLVRDGLIDGVPSPRGWKHAALPQRATAEQVTAALAQCRTGTPIGLRDNAVLLLLARLGLRAKEVVRLLLDDIDWHRGSVLIRAGKNHRERVLPLSEEVGSALVAYLEHGRPWSPSRAVFLEYKPPYRPWSGASAVSQLVRRRLKKSGFPDRPGLGAHLFRHTIASAMVNSGVSFKDVADILGHQSLQTTGIYAKLNLEVLSRVALPWSGGAQ